jgi:hypothetical protein
LRRLRLSAGGIAQAFEGKLDEPVPDRLLGAARGTGKQAREARRRPAIAPWAWGLAASVAAFALGLGSEVLLFPTAPGYIPAAETPSDPLAARFEVTLRSALDEGKDGQIFPYAAPEVGNGSIKLGSRFATVSGSPCREFWRQESRGRSLLSDHGIACRGANGSWSVMVLPGGG